MPIDIASGNVHEAYEDVRLPGLVELAFVRRYSGLLIGKHGGLFGPGWTTPFEAKLTRHVGGFEFISPTGGAEMIADSGRLVETGHTVAEPGAFTEV
ncbi:MAG: DUF6531 domain-containing protein, partial [Pseudomonadota bacterium]|nr:DUF6531 domain-containing protein [Pseudomonadota bacterium]